MGIYLNPRNDNFKDCVEKEIYVDKSLLIQKVWKHAKNFNKYICISRPRRFGKSTDADMMTAFFSKSCDSSSLFNALKIADWEEYGDHINSCNVIHINMQTFLSATNSMDEMLALLVEKIIKDLKHEFPDYCDSLRLESILEEICAYENQRFVFIIDEWDCIFREYKYDTEAQKKYLDYLRLLLKDHAYVKLAYMTGILPIKKYGTHSALNMFDEISMIDAKDYSEFMGFTETEVKGLCEKYDIDFGKMQEWYDGYKMRGNISTYSPRSVVASIMNRDFAPYWSQTETFDALREYIDLNYDGLKDTVISLLAGQEAVVDTSSFQNDMSTFHSADDVLTLLIHLGYVGYLYGEGRIFIPNNEVKDIFITSIKTSNWDDVTEIFRNSKELLEATWNCQAEKVAGYIEKSHYETSVLQYHDENALSYTVSLAYITAKEYYTIVRELPTGKGFADIVFLPKTDKPAMIVELKWDKDADCGIKQIKEKRYFLGLEKYLDNLLLVGINYDKDTKKHTCAIERYEQG